MKKFISAATCLAMAASMVSVAAPAVNAADATKTITLAAYKAADSAYSSMGSNIKVDQSAIDAGNVTIPVAIYLTEETNDSEILTLPVTIKSKDGNDVSGITYKTYNATEKYFSSNKSYKSKSGVSFSTNAAVSFDATTDDMDEYATWGKLVAVSDTKQESFDISTPYYCASWLGGGGYEWFGSKSDDYPVAVFDLVLPKGTKAGEYSLEFADQKKPGAEEVQSLCNISAVDKATKNKIYYDNFQSGANKLTTKNMTITVGDAGNVSTTQSQSQTTTTTTTTTTTSTPTGSGDLTLDFGKYEVDAGNSVSVDVKLAAGDVAVGGMDVFYQIDSPLTITGFGGTSAAYGASVDTNKDKLEQGFFAVSEGEPVKGEVGASVFKCKVSVPADTPTGDYKITFKSVEAYKSGQNSDSWDVNVIPGVIHVNGTSTESTTSTTQTVTESTTESTTVTTPDTEGDLTLDFGKYTGEKGGSVNVDVKLAAGDVAVGGMDVFYQIDSPLTITGFGGTSAAYGASVDTNKDKLEQGFFAVSEGEPVKGEVGASVFKCKVSIPADCPDGEYKITFKSVEAYKSGQNSDSWNVKVIPGVIKVGEGTTTTSSTTSETTTSTETTTQTVTDSTGELTPNYGDTNCDGVVNIADVVILNRHLADKDYALNAQSKLNADVFNPKGGDDLDANDSIAIIRHIIHRDGYKTFPLTGDKLPD